MTHKNERVLSVAELARVEGEGALYIRTSGNTVEEARLDIYEPPRFFEAFLRGRALHRAAGHHRPHLRHLPGRLPDERVRGDRGRLRRRRRTSRSPTCAGCCTAASGSRATRCTSTCCTPPTSSATPAGSRWPPTGATSWSAAWRLKKAGNAIMEAGRRAGHPPGQRPHRRLLPGAGPGRAGRAHRAAAPGARRRARATVALGGRASTFPITRARRTCSRMSRPGTYPIERGTRGDPLGPGVPGRRVGRARDRGARAALHRAARAPGRRRAATSPGRWPGTRSARGGCRRWPARRPATPGWARPATTRSAASSCGPWRWCTRSRRRCG